jgi:hypothetical protein
MKNKNNFTLIYYLVILASLLASHICLASGEYYIHEIYISSDDSSASARQQAEEEGIMRGFRLLASKIGISQEQASKISSEKIKSSVKKVDYISSTELDKGYEAVISVDFQSDKIDSLLVSASEGQKAMSFDKILLIPLLKQGSNYFTLEKDTTWSKIWKNYQDNLKADEIILMDRREPVKEFLNHKALKKINYSKIHPLIREYESWKGVILLAEYFTDYETGKVSLNIDRIILEPDSKRELNQKFPITSQGDVKNIILQIIEELSAPKKE